MKTSSYLFMSKRKRFISSRIMDKHSSSDSNISIDSLENVHKKGTNQKDPPPDDDVQTILVPFYENDVLIKIPRDQKKKQKAEITGKLRRDSQPSSYLIQKDVKKEKRTTYLEMFRKQFSPTNENKIKDDEKEIRSISPEYGDTERESLRDETHNQITEFYDTEAYNEIYYNRILNQDIESCLEDSFAESLRFTQDLRSKSPEEYTENNLRSVSEVSRPRRQRRATAQPIENVKLGGLGPDLEKIKPRLERARSLQRYSEKVRMENRIKIYKRSVQADMEKIEREPSARVRSSAKEMLQDEHVSYLVNKSKTNDLCTEKKLLKEGKLKKQINKNENVEQEQIQKKRTQSKSRSQKEKNKKPVEADNASKYHSVKSSARSRGVNTEEKSSGKEEPPVQISFLVNVGKIRPSSALKNLEEKHKMYQKQVKGFTMNNN